MRSHPRRRPEGRSRRARLLAYGFLAALLALPGGLAQANRHVETFVEFDPARGEFPEGIAVDKTGDVYVSMILLDQIRRIDPGGAHDVVAAFAPGTGPAGLAVDASGVLYVAAAALSLETFQTDPDLRGVYRVERDGTASRLPGSGAMGFPNDVTLDKRGNAYATDTFGGAVWRIPRGGTAELWAQHPLLAGDESFGFGFPIGANGIAFRHNRIIVANTERGMLVEIPVRPDGSAGTPTVLAQDDEFVGTDGIALDVHGTIHAATGLFNTVVRVDDGSVTTLATADDGLDQPSTMAFGTSRGQQQTLFVVNFAVFSDEPDPGVVKLPVGVPGQPLP